MELIYIVEDDKSIREIESVSLVSSNYEVCAFENANQFYEAMARRIPDLILLDIMLPDQNGYQIIERIRETAAWKRIPVIMVTAKSSDMDLVKGINSGADDYIKKPFSVMELISRVKARLRRADHKMPENKLSLHGIEINLERHQVTVEGTVVSLTYKEYELLYLLMSRKDTVLSRHVILQEVWDADFEGETRTVDMHIKTLRQKLGGAGKAVKTVRNVGYVMESE